jgi:hypothetical protein
MEQHSYCNLMLLLSVLQVDLCACGWYSSLCTCQTAGMLSFCCNDAVQRVCVVGDRRHVRAERTGLCAVLQH